LLSNTVPTEPVDDSINTIKQNIETLSGAIRDIGLEINAENEKLYDQKSEQNQNIRTANESLQNVGKFK
jgi:hypothetical protein